ncbi:MucR family transcriptional regulator [Azospirillum canadense]|uniref:MucR family transcriptional regulator n=1 Tax=Azospirillum canadense TaxID=403962 RepID=UPI002227785E|nr:MucR family transcriptional regulator [Azospirillum canadense]MCW2239250.1 putative transcriptional regulator [Azospirillum canadense]
MEREKLVALTAEIVASYVSANRVASTDIPLVVTEVFNALGGTGQPKVEAVKQEPAVPVKKSVTPDYIVCLEDGKKMKMLKRYLRTTYNMSPEEYRAKWSLPPDYPMTAPNYTAKRSEFAKQFGLGTKRRGTAVEAAPSEPAPTKSRRKKVA